MVISSQVPIVNIAGIGQTLQLFNSNDSHIDLFMKVGILLPVTGQQATREILLKWPKKQKMKVSTLFGF
jgi:hypothetical protein